MMPGLEGKAALIITYSTVFAVWKVKQLWVINLPHGVPLRRHPDLSSCVVFGSVCVLMLSEAWSSVPWPRKPNCACLAAFLVLCWFHVKFLSLGWLLAYLHASICLPPSAYHKWYDLKEWDFQGGASILPWIFSCLVHISKEGFWFILVCITENWWPDTVHALYEGAEVQGGQL